MRALLALTIVLGLVRIASSFESGSPEDTVSRYLRSLKDGKPDQTWGLVSKAMRQGKDKETWIKEQNALMATADVKIFDFTVYPGKAEGDKAQVPDVLESQDKFVNTLGLTEHELYTLVREEGAWRVDSQILLEPAEIPKWFPPQKKSTADAAPSH